MLSTCHKPAQSGFSLVELMIGVVILGILASVALPSFQVWLQNSEIRNAAESISNGLQRARAEAVARNANVEFVLTANSSWTICLPSVGPGCEVSKVIESRSASEGSKNVTVTMTPLATTTVTYNNFGRTVQPTNLDGSAPFTRVDVDSAGLSAAESQELRITLGIGGNIRMCDPNAPSGSPRAC